MSALAAGPRGDLKYLSTLTPNDLTLKKIHLRVDLALSQPYFLTKSTFSLIILDKTLPI